METLRNIVIATLEKCEERKKNDWTSRKNFIRDELRNYVYERTKRKPMILPIIMEI